MEQGYTDIYPAEEHRKGADRIGCQFIQIDDRVGCQTGILRRGRLKISAKLNGCGRAGGAAAVSGVAVLRLNERPCPKQDQRNAEAQNYDRQGLLLSHCMFLR